jgi:hypothetical protein
MSDVREFGFGQGDEDFRSINAPLSDDRNTPSVATMFPDWELFDTLLKHTLSGELQWERVHPDPEDPNLNSYHEVHYTARGGHLEYNLYFDEAPDPDDPTERDWYSYDMWWTLNLDWHLLPANGTLFTDTRRSYPALIKLFKAVDQIVRGGKP